MTTTFKMVRAGIIAAPLALAAGMASAGGLSEPIMTPAPTPVAVAPAPMRTTGDWTGFYAGGQLGYAQLDSDALPEDPEDMTYGVQAGYMYDMGSWVVGGELDINGTEIESGTPDVAVDAITRAKLRVGYDAGNWLPYATAGVAQARVSGDIDGEDTGAFVGLGADYRVSDSVIVGAEVIKHQFEDFDDSGVDIDATTAALRVSYKF